VLLLHYKDEAYNNKQQESPLTHPARRVRASREIRSLVIILLYALVIWHALTCSGKSLLGSGTGKQHYLVAAMGHTIKTTALWHRQTAQGAHANNIQHTT